MRVSLIGPGDAEFHFETILSMSKVQLKEHIEGVAKVLAEIGAELVLLPDRGVSFEIAKEYRKISEGKVVGTIVETDADFGIEHLKPFMNADVQGKRIFSEFLSVDNWYKRDHLHCLFGDVVLVLGYSLGSLGELCHGGYVYKLIKGEKHGLKPNAMAIHPQILAGKFKPFHIVVYQPLVDGKLPKEISSYWSRLSVDTQYARTPEELRRLLTGYYSKK